MNERVPPEAVRTPFRVRLLRAYCWTLLILLLYVLSTGPMYWRIYEAYNLNTSSLLQRIYLPIVLLCESSDTVNSWFNWYVGLWIGI